MFSSLASCSPACRWHGLKRLDYALYKANQLGIRVIIPFVNNWNAFGGIDQYVRWRTLQDPAFTPYHDRFYTDPLIRQWFKQWIAHLLNRTNSYTGIQYKNDPTIIAWELANEPRCLSAGVYGRSPDCTTQTLTAWAGEMSSYSKSIDGKRINRPVVLGESGILDGWTWCQSSWGWVNGGTTTTVEFDLNSLGCAAPELNKVQAINVWFSGNGVFYMDNVRTG